MSEEISKELWEQARQETFETGFAKCVQYRNGGKCGIATYTRPMRGPVLSWTVQGNLYAHLMDGKFVCMASNWDIIPVKRKVWKKVYLTQDGDCVGYDLKLHAKASKWVCFTEGDFDEEAPEDE